MVDISVDMFPDARGDGSNSSTSAPSTRLLGGLQGDVTRAGRRCCARSIVLTRRIWLALHFKAMLCSLCALMEGTFGWITGCAWTT